MYKFNYLADQDGYDADGNKIETQTENSVSTKTLEVLVIGFLPTGKTLTLWLIVACLLVSVFSAILTWLRWKGNEEHA